MLMSNGRTVEAFTPVRAFPRTRPAGEAIGDRCCDQMFPLGPPQQSNNTFIYQTVAIFVSFTMQQERVLHPCSQWP